MQKAIVLLKQFTSVTEQVTDEEYLTKITQLKEQLQSDIPIELNANQMAAVISLVADIGYYEFMESTVYLYLKRRNLLMAASNFPNYAKVGRILSVKKVVRRKIEKELFLSKEF